MLEAESSPRRVNYDIFECLLGESKAIYFSTPMTNGPRLLKWQRDNGGVTPDSDQYDNLFHENVLLPNCLEANRIVDGIRKETGQIVINPACFDMAGWSQEDYLTLWCSVIRKYSKEVWFNDGWEYSSGCVREYWTAITCGLPAKTLSGLTISVGQAVDAINRVVPDLEKVKIPTYQLLEFIERLKTLRES